MSGMDANVKRLIAAEILEHGVITPMITLGKYIHRGYVLPTPSRLRGLGYVRRFRGMGDVCTTVAGGSRVCSPGTPSPVALKIQNRIANGFSPTPYTGPGYVRVSLPATPVLYNQSPSGSQPTTVRAVVTRPQVPSANALLASAMAIYNTNPAALSQNQWSQLQAAGVIPSTLPYSSASQLPNAASAAAATTTTTATTATDLGTEISVWLTQSTIFPPLPDSVIYGGGALAIYFLLFSGKKGRR